MKNIQLLNKISPVGTKLFGEGYTVSTDCTEPEGIMVRSAAMLDMQFPSSLEAIARAGAGVNNIPCDRCADEGIVVFNTPGANANAVKELAICALMLASRDVVGGINWASTLEGNELGVAKAVEKGKSAFAGCEIFGKTLGIIGLGAIGRLLAQAATVLGMKIVGCDPFASNLPDYIKLVESFDEVYAEADYITLHVPATPQTKGMINSESISKMKDGVRILNLARADLVNAAELKAAIADKKVACYVTDFPTEETINTPGIIAMPHLGASTEESEDNCAQMAATELIDYLENGNIRNSVNFPAISLDRKSEKRIVVLGVGEGVKDSLTEAITGSGINIVDSAYSERKGRFAFIADTDVCPCTSKEALSKLDCVKRILIKNS